MFESHILAQAKLDQCEAFRRARNGDELALAHTHYDANGTLARLLALIRIWLSSAGHVRRAKRSPRPSEPVVTAPRLV